MDPLNTMHSTEMGIVEMLFSSGPVVQAVLVMLIVLSVITWAITAAKIMQLRKATKSSSEFGDMFWGSRDFDEVQRSCPEYSDSPLSKIFNAGYVELSQLANESQKESPDRKIRLHTVESALKRAERQALETLQSGTTFLATVATAAPFIGLFGTVWGIMTAFQGLSSAKTATIQAVAPGISEALIATAVGLAAAIPASIAYNFFASSIKKIRISMAGFSEEFLSMAKAL